METSVEMLIVIKKVKTGGTRLMLTNGHQITIQRAGVCPSAISDNVPKKLPKTALGNVARAEF